MIRTDLHTHTNYSDGVLSPARLLETAKQNKIEFLSLTDHDTFSGTYEAETAAKELDINFIPGIEVSSIFTNGAMHLLGYNIDRNNNNLSVMLDRLKEHRLLRNNLIIDKLRDMGLDISKDELAQSVGKLTTVGRPHIAEILIKKKYATNFTDAFERFLGDNKPAYVSKEIYEYEEVIQMIKTANGHAFLAHPVTLNLTDDEMETLLPKMKECGMDGIEIWNSRHTRTFNNSLLNFAKKFDLAVSGGSDYHGKLNSQVKIGRDYYGKWITKNKLSDILFT